MTCTELYCLNTENENKVVVGIGGDAIIHFWFIYIRWVIEG